MRCAILLVMLAMLGATAAAATPQQNGEFFSSEQVTGWISNYRTKPEPARLPAAVREDLRARFEYLEARIQTTPMRFACPSLVLRDGDTNSGATDPFQPWSEAVAQA